MFLWYWTVLMTTTVFPFAIAILWGWVPPWLRGRVPHARLRVKGVALLVLYAAVMLHPVFRLSGIPRDDADYFLPILFPALMFLALGLQGGAALNDRFNRTHATH